MEPVADLLDEAQDAAETIVSVKPSKGFLIALSLGGVALGVMVGWYLAGGLKLEQEFLGTNSNVVNEHPSVSGEVAEVTEDVEEL